MAELAIDETNKVERANVTLTVVDVDIETPWFLLSRPPRVKNTTPKMALSNYAIEKFTRNGLQGRCMSPKV
jgi:hypothetical protein